MDLASKLIASTYPTLIFSLCIVPIPRAAVLDLSSTCWIGTLLKEAAKFALLDLNY